MIDGTMPSATMRRSGIVHAGTPILDQPTRTLDLPTERDAAIPVIQELFAAMDHVARVHPFAK